MSTQEEAKKGSCPGCDGELNEVYAEAHYGRYLLLDQCQDCGGIWFDQWELYYLKEDEAERLDPVNKERLLAPLSLRKGAGLCPECEVSLEPFWDLNLPEDADIKRCPGCSGLWLNRGELKRYEDYKRGLRKGEEDAPSALHQSHLLTQEDQNRRLEELKNLGKALSTRVSPQIPDTIALDEPEIDRKELTKDLVWIIIQVLLRLFLKV